MDLFGRESPKERKRRILDQNIRRGRAAEQEETSNDLIMGGWSSKRTGRGHDYKQERFDILSGKREERFKEIKSGRAKLSSLQKEKQRKLGKKFVVGRRDPWIY
jgi:hypothetical protein